MLFFEIQIFYIFIINQGRMNFMIKLAFAGFRHGHINALYKLAEKNPDVEIVAAYEADADARLLLKKLGVRFNGDIMTCS